MHNASSIQSGTINGTATQASPSGTAGASKGGYFTRASITTQPILRSFYSPKAINLCKDVSCGVVCGPIFMGIAAGDLLVGIVFGVAAALAREKTCDNIASCLPRICKRSTSQPSTTVEGSQSPGSSEGAGAPITKQPQTTYSLP